MKVTTLGIRKSEAVLFKLLPVSKQRDGKDQNKNEIKTIF